jgi:hypothetical protein
MEAWLEEEFYWKGVWLKVGALNENRVFFDEQYLRESPTKAIDLKTEGVKQRLMVF